MSTTIEQDGSGYVDTHFHLDLFPDPAALVAEIDEARVETIAVTNAPSVFPHTQSLARNSRFVRAAVGLHPELVATHGRELERMWPFLDETRFVGEIGLDYVIGDPANRKAQKDVFAQIIERCARYGDKILTVHSRRAASDVTSTVGDGFPGKVILHWFSGSRRELERAIGYGFYFSVGPAMVRSKNGLGLLAAMPRDRVLTETDGPFVQAGGKPAKPSDAAGVIGAISKIWREQPEVTKFVVSQNYTQMTALGPS